MYAWNTFLEFYVMLARVCTPRHKKKNRTRNQLYSAANREAAAAPHTKSIQFQQIYFPLAVHACQHIEISRTSCASMLIVQSVSNIILPICCFWEKFSRSEREVPHPHPTAKVFLPQCSTHLFYVSNYPIYVCPHVNIPTTYICTKAGMWKVQHEFVIHIFKLDTISLMLFSLFVTGFKRECLMVNWFRLKTINALNKISIYILYPYI